MNKKHLCSNIKKDYINESHSELNISGDFLIL